MGYIDDYLGDTSTATPSQSSFGDSKLAYEFAPNRLTNLSGTGLYAAETVRAVAGGVVKVPYDIVATAADFSDWIFGTDLDMPGWNRMVQKYAPNSLGLTITNETTGGKVAQELVSLLTGFGIIGKLKYLKYGKEATLGVRLGKAAITGAVADFIFSDPEAPRLANLLPEEWKNPAIDFLRYDPDADEHRLAGRLKNSLEGLALGVPLDLATEAIKGTVGYLRVLRKGLHEEADASQAVYENMVKQGSDLDVTKQVELHKLNIEELPTFDYFVDSATKHMEEILRITPDDIEFGRKINQALHGDTPEAIAFREMKRHPGMVSQYFETMIGQGVFGEVGSIDEQKVSTFLLAAEKIGLAENMQSTALRVSLDEAVRRAEKIIETSGADESMRAASKLMSQAAGTAQQAILNNTFAIALMEKTAPYANDIARAFIENPKSQAKRMAFLASIPDFVRLAMDFGDVRYAAGRMTGDYRASRVLAKTPDGTLHDAMKMTDNILAEHPTMKAVLSGDPVDDQALMELAQKVVQNDGDYDMLLKKLTDEGKDIKEYKNPIGKALEQMAVSSMLSAAPATQVALPILSAVTRQLGDLVGAAQAKMFMQLTGNKEAAQEVSVLAETYGVIDGVMGYMKSFGKDVVAHPLDYLMDAPKALRKLGGGQTIMEAEGIPTNAISADALRHSKILAPLLNPNNPLGKITSGLVDAYGILANQTAFGAMTAVDGMLNNAGFTAKVKSGAFRVAVQRGYTPGTKKFADAVANLESLVRMTHNNPNKVIPSSLAESVHKIHQEAIEQGKRLTFREDLPQWFDSMNKVASADNNVARALRVLIWPFRKTPFNILRSVGEYTPVIARLGKTHRMAIAGELGATAAEKKFNQYLYTARMANGTALYAAGFGLAMAGVINGRHPPEKRKDLLNAGIPEYSVSLPDGRRIAYSRLDPVGFFLGISADMYTLSQVALEGEKSEKLASAAIVAFSSNVLNKSWFKGIADAVKAFDSENSSFVNNWIVEKASMFTNAAPLPGAALQRTIRDATTDTVDYQPSPEMGDLASYIDNLFGDQLILRPLLNKRDRVSPVGEVVKRDTSIGGRISTALGARSVLIPDNPGVLEAARFGVIPSGKERHWKGIKLTQTQQQGFLEMLSDTRLVDHLNALATDRNYSRLTDEAKASTLRKVIDGYYAMILNVMATQSPELRQAYMEKVRFDFEKLTRHEANQPATADDIQSIQQLISHKITRYEQ